MNWPPPPQLPNGGQPVAASNEHNQKHKTGSYGMLYHPSIMRGNCCAPVNAPQGSWEHNSQIPRPSMPDPRVGQYAPRWTQAPAMSQANQQRAIAGLPPLPELEAPYTKQ